jgi:thiol:disulfide interchange protein
MNCKPFLLLCIAALSPGALADIHKCRVDGKIVYTDQVCADNKSLPFTLTELNTTASTQVSYKGNIWLTDNNGYSVASDASVKENTPVLIYGYTDWCGYCKKLNQVYFNDVAVQKTLAQFIKVKLNPEHSGTDDRLFKSWGGRGYPTLYVQYPHQQPREIQQPFTTKNGVPAMMSTEEFRGVLQSYLKTGTPAENAL